MRSDDEQRLVVKYIEMFVKNDKFNAVLYCQKWNGTNGYFFSAKTPEDILFDLLEKIYEGKKAYLESYRNFKNSVYFHLNLAMKNYFHCDKKKDDLTEENDTLLLLQDNEQPNESEVELPSEVGGKKRQQKESARFVPLQEEFYFDGADDILFLLLDQEERELKREKIYACFDPNEDIEELLVLEEIFEGKKRQEIAEELNLTPAEVTNIEKRITRRLEKIKNQRQIGRNDGSSREEPVTRCVSRS